MHIHTCFTILVSGPVTIYLLGQYCQRGEWDHHADFYWLSLS
jgi:hypothetical protein